MRQPNSNKARGLLATGDPNCPACQAIGRICSKRCQEKLQAEETCGGCGHVLAVEHDLMNDLDAPICNNPACPLYSVFLHPEEK